MSEIQERALLYINQSTGVNIASPMSNDHMLMKHLIQILLNLESLTRNFVNGKKITNFILKLGYQFNDY